MTAAAGQQKPTPGVGDFLTNLVGELFSPKGQAESAARADARQRWDKWIAENGGKGDPIAFMQQLRANNREQFGMDQTGADLSLDRALRGAGQAVPIAGQVEDIRTKATNQRALGAAEADNLRQKGFVENRMPVLDKAIEGEYRQGQLQNDMFNNVLGAYERSNAAKIAYNERVLEATRPTGFERLLGNILPAAGFIAALVRG